MRKKFDIDYINTPEGRKEFLKGKKIVISSHAMRNIGTRLAKKEPKETRVRSIEELIEHIDRQMKARDARGPSAGWIVNELKRYMDAKNPDGLCKVTDVAKDSCYVRFGKGESDHCIDDFSTVRDETMIMDIDKKGNVIGIELLGSDTARKPCQEAGEEVG